MDDKTALTASAGKCPVIHTNRDWWPNQLNLQVLHQHSTLSDPMGEAFDYAKLRRHAASRPASTAS